MIASAAAMRVAVDVTPLLGPRTGVGAFVSGMLSALPDPSTEVRGFALTARRRAELAEVLPPGVALVRRPLSARLVRAAWLRWDRPSAELVGGTCDVVHGTNYVSPPARRAAEVVTVHDLTFVHFPQFSQRDTLDYRQLLKSAARRGAWFHTHTRFVAGELRDWLGVEPDRVLAQTGGIPDVQDVLAAAAEEGCRQAGAKTYILALGTEEPRKDLPTLVTAFDALASEEKEVVLVMAGARGWASEAVDAAIEQARNRGRIRRLGWVTPHRRNALLRGATVLAYPSVYEGFGYPPLQALAAGVPVVSTNAGALPEVLGRAARLVDRGDRDALTEALRAELNGRPFADPATRKAQADKFSWDALAEGLRSLYREARAEKG